MNKRNNLNNFCFTPLPEFDGQRVTTEMKYIGNSTLILRNNDKLQEIINNARERYDLISKKDFFNYFHPSKCKYFLTRVVRDNEISHGPGNIAEEARQAGRNLRLYLIALRLIKPIPNAGRICIYYYDGHVRSISDKTYIYVSREDKHNTVGLSELNRANRICKRIKEAEGSSPNRLLTSLLFFEQAQSKYRVLERYTNATAALESIFNMEPYEVTHQVSERLALFLGGKNSFLKNDIYATMKKVYGIRSQLVHGQLIPTRDISENPDLVIKLESYCRLTLLKIIDNDNLFRLYTVAKSKNKDALRLYFKELLFGKTPANLTMHNKV